MSTPDTWNKIDDFIFEWRYLLAAALIGVSLVGLGISLVRKDQTSLPQIEGATSVPALTQSGPLNLNTATAPELEALPGIGPALAARIIDYRTAHGPFKKVEDLVKVKGIGPKTLADFKDKVTVE